jgi:hypothetical protein
MVKLKRKINLTKGKKKKDQIEKKTTYSKLRLKDKIQNK